MTGATVSECVLLACHQSAEKLVAHSGRPEGETPLCEHHAATALEQVAGTEVLAND
jgi:hypothetical protein